MMSHAVIAAWTSMSAKTLKNIKAKFVSGQKPLHTRGHLATPSDWTAHPTDNSLVVLPSFIIYKLHNLHTYKQKYSHLL